MFRKKKKYSVLKLFGLMNIEMAKSIDVTQLTVYLYSLLREANDCKSIDYDVNFGEHVGLVDLRKLELDNCLNDCVYLSFACKDTENMLFSYSNSFMQGSVESDVFGIVDMYLVFPIDYFFNDSLLSLTQELVKMFPFDYGYLVDLPSNFDFGSEQKIKRGLFGLSLSNTVENRCWEANKKMIADGYFKNLYNINIVSEAQFLRFGKFEIDSVDVNSKLKIVSIKDKELGEIKDHFCKEGLLMGDKDCYRKFVDTQMSFFVF